MFVAMCRYSLPKVITDKYDVLSCLKESSVRQVYLIQNRESGERAVLKCGSGENGDLLFQEYSIANTLSGRCDMLLKSIDYFFEEHTHYYIREYAEGCSLAELVRQNGAFPEKECRRITAELCRCIDTLHRQEPPVIFRDINPDNVLLCDNGEIKLVDMDSARYYDKTASSDTRCIGTKEMAAPEQFGFTQTNERTDIYVLGMLLLYISTGTFDRYTKVPNGLKKIIEKSTSFDPKDRYSSAAEMGRALAVRSPKKAVILSLCAVALIGVTAAAVCLFGRGYPTENSSSAVSEVRVEAEFTETRIENALRKQLGKTEDEPLYLDEIEKAETLIMVGDLTFSDWEELEYYHTQCLDSYAALPSMAEPLQLDDLEMMKGLKYLSLDKQGLTDLSCLSGLSLEKLSIMDNKLTDISALAEQTELTHLKLSSNYDLTDISPLAELKNLKVLILSCCVSLEDVDCLTALPLELLHINYTEVKHIEGLSQLTTLKEFLFSQLDEYTLRQILHLTALEGVEICGCSAITDMSYFTGLDRLCYLCIADCENFTDISGVSQLPALDNFSVYNSAVSDLPEEISEAVIRNIDLRKSLVEDFEALTGCDTLQVIYADEKYHQQLYRLFSGRDVSIMS